MNTSGTTVKANADFCFGRDDLILRIIDDVYAQGSVLLFGGRQSGKTTILLKIQQFLSSTKYNVNILGSLTIPVYILANGLPAGHEATLSDLYRYLAKETLTICRKLIDGFNLTQMPSEIGSTDSDLDSFKRDLQTLRTAAGQVDIDFLFLIDEGGKLTQGHFVKDFPDQLFVILYRDC